MQTKREPTAKQNKRRVGFVLAAVVAILLLACLLVGKPMLELAAQPETFRAWVDDHGLNAQLTYTAMVLFQVVVAIIPGEPLEIAGGYAFGAVEGTILFFAGATLGSMLVFGLVRRFGVKFVRLFFGADKLEKLRFLQKSPKRSVLFLLIFMIPGTPKDLLCYFAGLTDMRWQTWLLIASFGRIPSLVTSTLGGSALGEGSYLLAGIVFAAASAISVAGLLVYQYICSRHNR